VHWQTHMVEKIRIRQPCLTVDCPTLSLSFLPFFHSLSSHHSFLLVFPPTNISLSSSLYIRCRHRPKLILRSVLQIPYGREGKIAYECEGDRMRACRTQTRFPSLLTYWYNCDDNDSCESPHPFILRVDVWRMRNHFKK